MSDWKVNNEISRKYAQKIGQNGQDKDMVICTYPYPPMPERKRQANYGTLKFFGVLILIGLIIFVISTADV